MNTYTVDSEKYTPAGQRDADKLQVLRSGWPQVSGDALAFTAVVKLDHC